MAIKHSTRHTTGRDADEHPAGNTRPVMPSPLPAATPVGVTDADFSAIAARHPRAQWQRTAETHPDVLGGVAPETFAYRYFTMLEYLLQSGKLTQDEVLALPSNRLMDLCMAELQGIGLTVHPGPDSRPTTTEGRRAIQAVFDWRVDRLRAYWL